MNNWNAAKDLLITVHIATDIIPVVIVNYMAMIIFISFPFAL